MILLYPILRGGKNRFLKSKKISQVIFRDGVVLLLACMIMIGGYAGTGWILKQLESAFSVAYMSPTMPLYLMFLILFGLLVISNIVSFSGAFYQSEDLELLLASPLSSLKIFFQRFFVTALATSLVSFIFVMPIILAYAFRFHAGLEFFLGMIFLLVPYFCIPATIGFLAATLLAYAAPLRRSKIFFLFFILLFLGAVWYGVELVQILISAKSNTQDLSKLLKIFSVASISWSPSTWLIECMDTFLKIGDSPILTRALLLFGSALIGLGLAGIVFERFHGKAYAESRSQSRTKQFSSSYGRRWIHYANASQRVSLSYVMRDGLLLIRDVAQLFQGVLLFGVFTIYIYNLRVFTGLSVVGPDSKWWSHFLFISNFCMASFIALALCTRFVFPSISIEGRAFYTYLVKAPISFSHFLNTKFYTWFLVVATFQSIAMLLGTFASGGTSSMIGLYVICSIAFSYGIVGIAIGLGALYSRFDWEHLSQLAVGYGNIIFMLTGAFWVLIHFYPVWLIISLPGDIFVFERMLILFALISLNFLAQRFCMRRGERGLRDHTL
jgi:ABC-2 type transport system permease protein